jgi:hypothetical protein
VGGVTAWLGVVSRDHVRSGVEQGIAQIGHGGKAGLARMQPGDTLVYYSPRASADSPASVRTFTAVGVVADDEVWQLEQGEFHPWRRRVAYEATAREVPIDELRDRLDLTRDRNWGFRLRRGLVELSGHDLALVREAMGARAG